MDLRHEIRSDVAEVKSCGLFGERGVEKSIDQNCAPAWMENVVLWGWCTRCKAVGAKAKREPRMRAVGLGRTEKSGEQMLRLLSHCTSPILVAEEEKGLVPNWETGEGEVKLDRRN